MSVTFPRPRSVDSTVSATDERSPLLRSPSSASDAAFNKVDLEVYPLIIKIRRDITVRDAPFVVETKLCSNPFVAFSACKSVPSCWILPLFTILCLFPLLLRVDSPLSMEQLASPKIAFRIFRPLEDEYNALNNPSILFCLMVVRLHFIKLQTHTLSMHSVNATRASICEILASNILRRIAEEPLEANETKGRRLIKLANLLARSFSPFQGAPASAIPEQFRFVEPSKSSKDYHVSSLDIAHQRGHTSALELSLVSEAKQFIRSSPCQSVVEGIYTGQIIYSANAYLHILPDKYKRKPIALYDPAKAPLLDHYRLQVPRIRQTLETTYFMVLFISYFLVLETREVGKPPNLFEIWFILYGLGFTLDKFCSTLEHGWKVFASNLWNGLDALFCITFLSYLILLLLGQLEQHHAVLSCAAVFLLPRLAFLLLSENVLVLALRAMLSEFFFLMMLAIWCFSGFLYAFWLLAGKEFGLAEIAEYMTWIWFGLDGSGIDASPEFHPILGPILFVLYACLANTLLITILVSILTLTFANISQDANAEGLFRRTVVIFAGIKADGLFNYQPPVNLIALFVLVPVRLLVTPRLFHTINVACTRLTSGPILLLVAILERKKHPFLPHWKRTADPEEGWSASLWASLVKRFSRFSARAEVEAVFDVADDWEKSHPSTPPHTPISRQPSNRDSQFLQLPPKSKKPIPQLGALQQQPRRRRESALAALFVPESSPSRKQELAEPEWLNDMRERMTEIEAGQKRIEAALDALMGSSTEGH